VTARLKDLPVHAPVARSSLEAAFARRAVGRRDARRVAAVLADAEERARAVIAQAQERAAREVESIFAAAKEEARAILDSLPDIDGLAALDHGPASGIAIVHGAADAEGISLAVLRSSHSDRARAARRAAILDLRRAYPDLAPERIADLIGCPLAAVLRILAEGGA